MASDRIKRLSLLGILLALALGLSYLESLIPLPTPLPGIKLGLSNTVTMFCLFFLGGAPAFVIAALKSAFALLTRGVTAGLLSAAGGALSVGAMLLLRRCRASIGMTSIAGAVAHNMGQLALASLMLKSDLALWYAPALILSGVVMGLVTGAVLRLLLPALRRTGLIDKNKESKAGESKE